MIERAMAVPPSRAFVFDVTALAPSTIVTTPRTPTSRISIATRTSMRVKPDWDEGRVRDGAIRTCSRLLACASRGVHLPMAIGPIADPLPLDNGGPLNDEGRARRPAPLTTESLTPTELPGVGGGTAAALVVVRARLGDGRAGLQVRERGARLRRTDDLVPGGALARNRQSAQRKAAAGDVSVRGVAANVRLGRGEARLHVRNEVTHVGLRLGVLTLLTLTKERRQRDGGQDADDQNDDEQLDEGEALLPVMNALAELPQHVSPP